MPSVPRECRSHSPSRIADCPTHKLPWQSHFRDHGIKLRFGVEAIFYCPHVSCLEFTWEARKERDGTTRDYTEDEIAANFWEFTFDGSHGARHVINASIRENGLVVEMFRQAVSQAIFLHRYRQMHIADE